ncbi:Hsp20/alpha crystallin family protein [Andreprevotia chitinilytica]|uniref:Hsp20/alpha crystallin family protein n=1 Tax=Andreprevotia chitinilytica TaxID=396808 RepID=UPI0005554E0E|nr:Hsp20/alpha crystallin family protein [Andreprevotia chitinilytica]
MTRLATKNIQNWLDEPFRSADDLLRGFFLRPVELGSTQFKIDVSEDDKNYVIHAGLPGVKKEDIDVEIDGSNISISAEMRRFKEEREGDRVLLRERQYGRISRTFQLANDVDDASAKAKFEDGVLELELPKRVTATPIHRLTIK